MNLVRSVMSFFLLVLIFLAVAGFYWAGGLPAPKCSGARVALALCALMSSGSMFLLWKEKQPEVTQ